MYLGNDDQKTMFDYLFLVELPSDAEGTLKMARKRDSFLKKKKGKKRKILEDKLYSFFQLV